MKNIFYILFIAFYINVLIMWTFYNQALQKSTF